MVEQQGHGVSSLTRAERKRRLLFLYSVIGWSILLLATWNALDTLGVVVTCALLGAIVWVFVDW